MDKKITILVTQNNTDYINWQMELMYNSFINLYKNDKNIDFISIVVSQDKKLNFKYPYYLCEKDTYANIVPGDHYVIYDRACSIKEYLDSYEFKEDKTFLFVEADFLFLNKINLDINTMAAQRYAYMDPKDTFQEFAKKAFNFYKEKVNPDFKNIEEYYRPIGWPFIIKESVLRKIVNRWIELTILFRSKDIPGNVLYKNWICDMFAFNFALAEAELIPKVIDILDMPPYGNSERDPLFYHYCYKIEDKETKKTVFCKREYKPWSFIAIDSSVNIGKDSRDLIKRINNFAFKKQFKL